MQLEELREMVVQNCRFILTFVISNFSFQSFILIPCIDINAQLHSPIAYSQFGV